LLPKLLGLGKKGIEGISRGDIRGIGSLLTSVLPKRLLLFSTGLGVATAGLAAIVSISTKLFSASKKLGEQFKELSPSIGIIMAERELIENLRGIRRGELIAPEQEAFQDQVTKMNDSLEFLKNLIDQKITEASTKIAEATTEGADFLSQTFKIGLTILSGLGVDVSETKKLIEADTAEKKDFPLKDPSRLRIELNALQEGKWLEQQQFIDKNRKKLEEAGQ